MWIPAVDRVFHPWAEKQPLAEAESKWISDFLAEERPPEPALATGTRGTRWDSARGVGNGDLQFGGGTGWIATAGGSWRAAEKGLWFKETSSSKAGVGFCVWEGGVQRTGHMF